MQLPLSDWSLEFQPPEGQPLRALPKGQKPSGGPALQACSPDSLKWAFQAEPDLSWGDSWTGPFLHLLLNEDKN